MACLSASDLSAAMGHLGDPGHNDVQAAIRAAIFQITSAGKAAGILSTDVALARDYAELGPTFVAFGTDVGLLLRGGAALLRSFYPDRAPPERRTAQGAVY